MIETSGYQFYNVEEIAEILKISVPTVRKYIRENTLKTVIIARRRYMSEQDLNAFLEETTGMKPNQGGATS